MSYELDHLFLMTDEGAPAGASLVASGFIEGTSNTHSGQGTTNRRFFFDNAMFELIWVHDSDEAGSELTRPTHLLERWRGRHSNASPFGICLRPGQADIEQAPFSAWGYQPAYLPEGFALEVADNAAIISEPFLFYVRRSQPRDAEVTSQPRDHSNGLRMITAVRIVSPPGIEPSDTLKAVEGLGLVSFGMGEKHHITLEFDRGLQGEKIDFRPELPLTVVR